MMTIVPGDIYQSQDEGVIVGGSAKIMATRKHMESKWSWLVSLISAMTQTPAVVIASAATTMEKAIASRTMSGSHVALETTNHRLLMHTKYMHELCSLLIHIPTYQDVISCYNHILH
jgi:hypothetical protein